MNTVQPAIQLEERSPLVEIDYKSMTLQEICATPKYLKILRLLKFIDKCELHAHLGGAISKEFLQKYLSADDFSKLTFYIEKIREGIDYSKCFTAFSMIGAALNSNERMEEAACDFCRSQVVDGVTLTELRTGLKRLNGGSFRDYLDAVLNGLSLGASTYSVAVTLVLSLRRDTYEEDANEIVNLAIEYFEQGLITGLDISGDSTKGDCSGIFKAVNHAREHGIPITLHIGENINENPAQQILELETFRPSRVGHAVFLGEQAKQWIIDNKIPIEACLRSAVSVMIPKPGDHSALELFKNGHPVIFCSDDSLLFGDLTEELALAACLCDLTVDEVVELQRKAVGFAFERKEKV